MTVTTIVFVVSYLTTVSLANGCSPWCVALSQCIGSNQSCACCSDNSYLTSRPTFCHRDKECTFFGDCCDADETQSLQGLPDWSCESIGASPNAGRGYTLMVKTCSSEGVDPTGRQKCANATSFPVTSNTSGVTYANQYCAVCNGERPVDLAFWRQRYVCPVANYTNVPITDLIYACRFQQFEAPKCPGCVTRSCIPTAIRTCPRGYPDDRTARRCKSYSCPVVWEDNAYMNLDCAFCNGVPPSATGDMCTRNYSSDQVELLNSIYFNDGSFPPLNHMLLPVSLSLLLDVQNSVYELGGSSTGDLSYLCGAGQVFVPNTIDTEGYCQDQVCLPGEVRTGTECLALHCSPFNQSANGVESGDGLSSMAACVRNLSDACVQLHSNDTRFVATVQQYGPLNQTNDGYVGTIGGGNVYKFNGSLYFCFKLSQSATPEHDLRALALVCLTYVCGVMSIVGCVVLIVTYSLFRELRTLPGKLLMNLAVAILVSDLVLLGLLTIANYTDSQKYCVSVAIILHFTFLSRFSWMSVIAFHLLVSFSYPFLYSYSSKLQKYQGEKKVFLCAFAFGWLSPLLIVVVCVVLHFWLDLIEYGGNGRCWIAKREALIGGFVVPVYLSVLFSAACFVITCWSIFRAKQNKSALTGTSKSQVRLYISLGILMGLTWLFGFIAMSVKSVVPWYFFIVLNGTQGLLLSLAFVCTKRNAGLCRSLCRGKALRGVKSLNNATSSLQLRTPDSQV